MSVRGGLRHVSRHAEETGTSITELADKCGWMHLCTEGDGTQVYVHPHGLDRLRIPTQPTRTDIWQARIVVQRAATARG